MSAGKHALQILIWTKISTNGIDDTNIQYSQWTLKAEIQEYYGACMLQAKLF